MVAYGSYHGAGIGSMGATAIDRLLGSGVCTGLGEAAGSPGPRAAREKLLPGEGEIRCSSNSLPGLFCSGDGCWLPQW